jgi:DNA-binding MarR family transcriptional regulator
MDIESRRDLEMLDAVAQNDRITQRTLAQRLGIAVGLTNMYVKRLARKGYIKCVNVRSNRIRYLITPKGIAEKTRLTYEYMDYSLQLYREVRSHLRTVLRPLAANGHYNIAIYGTGEAAELTYLSLKEFGLEPIVIFDDAGGAQFLGMKVAPVSEQQQFAFDILIVATLENASTRLAHLAALGVPSTKLIPLRSGAEDERA